MACYFRHLRQVFKKAGIEVTREKKIAEDEEDLISKLKEAWSKRV